MKLDSVGPVVPEEYEVRRRLAMDLAALHGAALAFLDNPILQTQQLAFFRVVIAECHAIQNVAITKPEELFL